MLFPRRIKTILGESRGLTETMKKINISVLQGMRKQGYIYLLLILATLFCLYCFSSICATWTYYLRTDECFFNGSRLNENAISRCISGPSIFFVETSESSELNARQACSVESASRHNPTMSVTLLMTGDSINVSNPYVSILQKLPKMQLRCIDVGAFVRGSPLWSWFQAGEWNNSEYKIVHLSDALRLLIMWKYGGMYLDLDTVTLRSMECLRNSAVTENWESVANGILIFDRLSELMSECVKDFSLNYDKSGFATNGPYLISNNIRKFCKVDHIIKVPDSNCSISILPPEAAFPIYYTTWRYYFQPNNVINIANYFNSSYLIHVWNKLSIDGKLKIGENSLYETAMQENCPLVYEYAKTNTYI